MNKALILILLVYTFILCGCESSKHIEIKGTRIIEPHFNVNRFLIYIDDKCDTIDLRKFELMDFSNPTLSHSKDLLYLKAYWKNEELGCYYHQILKFDINGNLLDTVFQANTCFDISSYSLAPNDTLMLIRTNNYNDWYKSRKIGQHLNISPSSDDEKKYPVSNFIINVISNEVVDTFSYSSSFTYHNLNEYSWSPDCKKVIIDKKNEFHYTDNSSALFYVYDIDSRSRKKIDFGYNVIWSQTEPNKLFYFKEGALWKYNLINDNSTKITQLARNMKFKELKITPKEEFLIINYYDTNLRWCSFLGDILCPSKAYSVIIDSKTEKVVNENGKYVFCESWRK